MELPLLLYRSSTPPFSDSQVYTPLINFFFCATADEKVVFFLNFRPCKYTSMCTHKFDKK